MCGVSLYVLKVFHDVAYKAKDRNDLLSGIDEFLDQVTVLPPGEWDPSIRIEPPKNVPSQVTFAAENGLGLGHSQDYVVKYAELCTKITKVLW